MKTEKIKKIISYLSELFLRECSCKIWSLIVIISVAAVIGGAALIAFTVDPL